MERSSRTLVGRVLREPLLHFLFIGIAVFALYRGGSDPQVVDAQRVIKVTPARVEQIAGQFEAVWRRRPTEAELSGLVDDFVREEVYYREALALGLDRDDTVIRRRLRQKMEFLGDAGAGAVAPEEAELRAHYEQHRDRFAVPARVTFRQVFLGDADPAPVLAELAKGIDPDGVRRGTLLPPAMEAAVQTTVDGTFGQGFFAAVAALPSGGWQGPVRSSFGLHLVELVEIQPAGAPPFEVVRPDVEEEWRRQAAEDSREAEYRKLRARYKVVGVAGE
jgi:hypothetical protein